jgi:cation transport ATPase
VADHVPTWKTVTLVDVGAPGQLKEITPPSRSGRETRSPVERSNQTGGFLMRAQRIGNDTLLASIVRLVGQAQRSRAPVQRLADRVSAFFVPAVLAAAVLTFVIWALVGPEPRLAQNLFFAFAYNLLGLPLAAGVFYPVFGWLLNPMLASAAMSISSVSVIANALRLRHIKV